MKVKLESFLKFIELLTDGLWFHGRRKRPVSSPELCLKVSVPNSGLFWNLPASELSFFEIALVT
jgi:hypothetical protein